MSTAYLNARGCRRRVIPSPTDFGSPWRRPEAQRPKGALPPDADYVFGPDSQPKNSKGVRAGIDLSPPVSQDRRAAGSDFISMP